jgi:hypothetical protein
MASFNVIEKKILFLIRYCLTLNCIKKEREKRRKQRGVIRGEIILAKAKNRTRYRARLVFSRNMYFLKTGICIYADMVKLCRIA